MSESLFDTSSHVGFTGIPGDFHPAFYTLRQKVQRQRGEAFDLGKYHEEVLNQGCISVKYLPDLFGVK